MPRMVLRPSDILGRVHDDDVLSDAALVTRLVGDQFPAWAGLSVTPVTATGTDNLVYRLGDDLVVRMPRIHGAVAQVARDAEWLPRLDLPVAVPEPVAVGEPGHGYPFPWAVHRWLPGTNPVPGDDVDLARDLASVVVRLRSFTDGPPSSRSGPLHDRDSAVREALDAVSDEVDAAAALAVWEEALAAPLYDGPPVLRHGDLTCGNLLVQGGRLSAVIDWGTMGLGDPAVDLVPRWRVFRGAGREAFTVAAEADDAAWVRARGWALSIALLELSYYRGRAEHLADGARVGLREVLLP